MIMPERSPMVDMKEAELRMKRCMRFDLFFKKQEMEAREEAGFQEESEEGDGAESIEGGEETDEEDWEQRLVRDREEKMNLPRGLSLPPGLRRFEGANELLLTARSNFVKKKPNISPEERSALKDLVTAERKANNNQTLRQGGGGVGNPKL